MAWHIISIGDEAYLFKIFQFLSMLNSPGTSLYGTLGMLGALIGLMLLIFQVVSSSGRNFSFGSLLIGVVMFTVLFGTSTSVELEDFHTGRTDIVSGVPLGTAIVGTMVSRGGVELINLFQQGTAVPGQEVMPSDYALRALSATYSLASMPGCGNNAALCPLKKTLHSYLGDCVYPQSLGLGTGTQGWANGDPTTSPDALQSIQTSNHFTVTTDYIHDTTGNPVSETCADTYTDIQKAFTSTADTDAFSCQYLAAAGQAVPAGSPAGTCTSQAQTLLQNSFNGLQGGADTSGGQSEGSMSSLIQAAQSSNLLALQNLVIASAAHDAQLSGGKGTASDIANAAMVESAAQQRDIKYAAEESMFGRTLNATIAFFEGVIYGLAPFMAFLVPLGAIGVKFLLQYFKLLLWLFLWLPLLSFVNLYEIMATMRQMNALQPTLNGAPLYSMVGIMQVQNSAADWIALGGWFTTSIIGLSGMIVFGSVAAFSSIAQAAHGPDAIDSTATAPELATSAPAIQRGSDYTSAGAEGLHQTGMKPMVFSNEGRRAVAMQLTQQQLLNEAHQLGWTGATAQNLTVQGVQAWAKSQYGVRAHQAAVADATRETTTVGVRTDDGFNQSDQVSTDLTTSAGINRLGVGVGVGVGGRTNWGSQDTVGRTASAGEDKSHGVNSSDSVDGGSRVSTDNSGSTSSANSKSDQWTNNLNKLVSDVHSYQVAESEGATSQASVSVDSNNVAQALTQTEAGRATLNELDSTVSDLGAEARAYQQQKSEQLQTMYPGDQAHAVATMATLQHFSDNGSGESRLMATEALSRGLNVTSPLMDASSSMDTSAFDRHDSQVSSITSQAGKASEEVVRTLGSSHAPAGPGLVSGEMPSETVRAHQAVEAELPGLASGKDQKELGEGMEPVFDYMNDKKSKELFDNSKVKQGMIERDKTADEIIKESEKIKDSVESALTPPAHPSYTYHGH